MIDIALFGLGRIGVMHGKNLMRNREFNLKYIYDIDKNLSKKYSKILKSIAVNSPSEIFKDKDIKAIFIASTTSTHIKLILEGVKNKKIIFCEKPLDLNIQRVVQCRKKIKRFKPKIQLGFNRRYDPGHYHLKKSLLSGKIGKLEKIIITSRDPAPPSFNYLKNSGGIFRDMTIHDFDLARFYLDKDPIKEIFASATNLSDSRFKKIKDYEIASCVLKSKKGVITVINNSRHCKFGYDQRVEIFGNKGMLISDNKRKYNFFIDRYKIAYKLQLNDLYNLVTKNKKPRSTFDDGEKSLCIANAAFKSLKLKKIVTI